MHAKPTHHWTNAPIHALAVHVRSSFRIQCCLEPFNSFTPSPITTKAPYKNPLLRLVVLERLLFLFGISIPWSSLPFPYALPGLQLPEMFLKPCVPFSTLKAFHAPSSLSNLNALSFSSLNSRSALRALSFSWLSLDCNSSIVLNSFSTLSRWREISSCSCALDFSLRSIWS
jgi:hypothetical protein